LSYLYCLVIALSHVIADTSSELHGNLIIHTRLPRHPSPNDNSLNGWGRNRGRESPVLFVQSLAGIANSIILLISSFPGQPSIVTRQYNIEDLPCRFLRSSLL